LCFFLIQDLLSRSFRISFFASRTPLILHPAASVEAVFFRPLLQAGQRPVHSIFFGSTNRRPAWRRSPGYLRFVGHALLKGGRIDPSPVFPADGLECGPRATSRFSVS